MIPIPFKSVYSKHGRVETADFLVRKATETQDPFQDQRQATGNHRSGAENPESASCCQLQGSGTKANQSLKVQRGSGKKTAYLVATEMGVVIALKSLCHLVVCADSYRLIQ